MLTGPSAVANNGNQIPSPAPSQIPTQAPSGTVSEDDDAVKGSADASVTIIEFSDYECPFCGRYFQETYPKIVSEYIDTGKVRYIFRDFPLSFHPNAQKAAEAAEAARELGGDEKYYEMHDAIFGNQQSIGISDLKGYAREIGLDGTKFDQILDSGKYASEVQKDFQDGQRAGVTGTPSFFINGRQLVGAQPFEAFQQIIEQELN